MKRWRAEGIRDRVERSSSERFRGEDQKGCQRERLQHLRVIAARTRKRVFLFFFFAFFVDIAVGHRARASRRSDGRRFDFCGVGFVEEEEEETFLLNADARNEAAATELIIRYARA